MGGVFSTTLEIEATVIAREETSEAEENFSQRRMNIEVEFSLEVMTTELAKVGFIPNDEVGLADIVETCPT